MNTEAIKALIDASKNYDQTKDYAWKTTCDLINEAKTQEEKEAIALAFILRGRRINANQIIDKLFNVQPFDDPTRLTYYQNLDNQD